MNTKHSELHALLAGSIRAGKYGAGRALPSEISLVRRFGVSRTTVQRALRDLEREGLVEKMARKGTFVIPAARRDRTVRIVLPDTASEADARLIVKAARAVADKLGFQVIRTRKGRP